MGELVIRVDPVTAERLNRAAERGRDTAQEIALAAIQERLEELEEAPAALKRLKEVQEGQVTTVPHDQAMRDLGLAD